MNKVITYKKMKTEVETVMSYGDVLVIIEENLGADVVNALLDFTVEETKNNGPSMIDYVEDGVFSEQIEESGVIAEIVKMVICDLDSQGYIKKNKSIDKFNYEDIYYKEIIDEKLSPGIMNYFEQN